MTTFIGVGWMFISVSLFLFFKEKWNVFVDLLKAYPLVIRTVQGRYSSKDCYRN